MKILNGGTGSGSGESTPGRKLRVGDILTSAAQYWSDNKLVSLNYDRFIDSIKYPDLIQYQPFNNYGANLVTKPIENQTYEGGFLLDASFFETDELIIAAGHSLTDGTKFIIKVNFKNGTEGYAITVSFADNTLMKCYFDYNGKIYIYKDAVGNAANGDLATSNVTTVVDVLTKVSLNVTHQDLRIVKAYFDRVRNKVVSLQFPTEEGSTDYTLCGWYEGDQLNTSTLDLMFSFNTSLSYNTLAKLYTNTAYLQNGNYCYYDEAAKKINYSNDNSTLFAIVNEGVTPEECILIIEKFNKIFICYAHTLNDVKYLAWSYLDKYTDIVRSVTTTDLTYNNGSGQRHKQNTGLLLNEVYTGDWESYQDVGLIYQVIDTSKRKAISFYDGYVFEDISTYTNTYVAHNWFYKSYGADINLSEVYNTENQNTYYLQDNFKTIQDVGNSQISTIHFNGFDFMPFLLFPAMPSVSAYTNYLIIKED